MGIRLPFCQYPTVAYRHKLPYLSFVYNNLWVLFRKACKTLSKQPPNFNN